MKCTECPYQYLLQAMGRKYLQQFKTKCDSVLLSVNSLNHHINFKIWGTTILHFGHLGGGGIFLLSWCRIIVAQSWQKYLCPQGISAVLHGLIMHTQHSELCDTCCGGSLRCSLFWFSWLTCNLFKVVLLTTSCQCDATLKRLLTSSSSSDTMSWRPYSKAHEMRWWWLIF